MAQPYLPPGAPPNPPTPEETIVRRRFWKRAIWGSSMLTIFPVLLGIGATVVSMMNAFSELDRSGAGDTGQLSVQIGVALRGTAVGLAVSIVGLVLLVISIIRYRAIRSMPQQ